jgi:penicillin-binding protein 1A
MTAPAPAPHAVVTAVAERRSRSARLRRRRRQVVLWLVLAMVAGAVTFAAGLLAAPVDYSFQPQAPQAVILLDSHGRPFATIRSPQNEDPVTTAQIPTVVRDAFVAAEDERFFAHSGVDPIAAVRALWRDVSGAKLQGGSTITQQYVKNVYTGDQRTPLRKLREASLAIRLEQHLSKTEILTRYLNTLYLGNGTAGVQAASRFYFGVSVTDLDLDTKTGKRSASLALARAATIAGIAPAPSVWNPLRDKGKVARDRELYVLNRMIANHFITPQQASDAYGSHLPAIVAQSEPEAPTVAPEFRDMVENRLKQVFATNYDSEMFGSGGVRVTTTLDLDLQKAAVQALHQVLPSASDPWAAVAAVDPRTGDIRAITTKIGGGYKKGGLNLATRPSYRSSGSTIKPFTLAEALIRGHSLDESAYAPECLNVGVGYHVCNAEKGSSYQTLRTALVQSINTVYAPLGVKVGLQRVVNLARAAGMDIQGINCFAHGNPCPSFSLGIPTNALGEAVSYGTLVNHGVHHAPNSVLDVRSADDGDVFDNRGTRLGEQVIPRKVADEVASVMRQVVDNGTGTAAQQPFPVAGKTGTTDDFTNAWFTGCSSTLCISVWMGYNQQYLHGGKVPHSMKNVEGTNEVFGGTLPAKIFARMFSDYRELRRPKPATSPTPAATTVQSFRPQSHPTSTRPSVTRPTHSPTPRPSNAPPTPSTAPSPAPSRSLLPTPSPP